MSNAVSDRRDSRLERLVAAPMLRGLRRGGCFPRWLLWIAVAASHDAGQWHIVPKDDLVTYEAFEYAIKTVNTMRKHCNHMVLAPLATVDFGVVKADVRSDDVHTTYRLAIAGKNAKGIRFEVLVAQQRAAMDLSVFTLDHVLPEPCALSSEIDDANLEVGYDSDFAEKAKEVRTPLTSPSWTFQQTDLNVI